MSITLDGTTGITTPTYAGNVTAEYSVPVTAFKNRIINGAMVIDQRNAGASIATSTTGAFTFTLDRWAYYATQASKFTIQQNAGSVTPPAGFTNYLGMTVGGSAVTVGSSDLFVITQKIEGYTVADLGFGTANASTITFSFWVYSSLTGTFGGGVINENGNRAYVFSYSISSANTWTKITVTIPGDVTGTWPKTNSIGMYIDLSLGAGSTWQGTLNSWTAGSFWSPPGCVNVVGSANATFYVTGVQLEKGSNATSFDYRPYGTELQLCQRYCINYKASDYGVYARYAVGFAYSTTLANCVMYFPVAMRAQPTLATTGTASNYAMNYGADAFTACSAVPSIQTNQSSPYSATILCTLASGFTAGNATLLTSNNNTTSYLLFSAEL